jgi:hypothetical protein
MNTMDYDLEPDEAKFLLDSLADHLEGNEVDEAILQSVLALVYAFQDELEQYC